MPPLPSTFNDETQNLIGSIERRKEDLHSFQIPRLQTCQGHLAAQQNLAAELRDDIDFLERQVEALDLSVQDQKGLKNKRDLAGYVDTFKNDLASLRKDFREALLFSKRAIDAQNKSRRDELLGSSMVTKKSTGDPNDALMKAKDDVTEALRRVTGAMQSELERSVLSYQMLEASTASLKSTSATHDILDNVMGTSKQLITALEKSDWMDRVLILASLFFFFCVVLFVLKERVLDRTVRVAFWWIRFIPKAKENKILSMTAVSMAASISTTLSSSASTSPLKESTDTEPFVITTTAITTSPITTTTIDASDTIETVDILKTIVTHEEL